MPEVASVSSECVWPLPRVSIRQSWDTRKKAVPEPLRVLNMRLQSSGEFLYNLSKEIPVKHNCLMPWLCIRMVYILTPGYLGLFFNCFWILFWKTTWSTAKREKAKDKDHKNQKWKNWFHLLEIWNLDWVCLPISLDVPPCFKVTPASRRKTANTLSFVTSGAGSFGWRPVLRLFFASIERRQKTFNKTVSSRQKWDNV